MLEEINQTLAYNSKLLDLAEEILEIAKDSIGRRTIEINSGYGFFSKLLAKREEIELYLSDPDKKSRDALQTRFSSFESVKDIFEIEINHPNFNIRYQSILNIFQTAIAVNAFDHAYLDKEEITNLGNLVKVHGRIIFIAPIFTSYIYGYEESLEEWKAIHTRHVESLLPKERFRITKIRFINFSDAKANSSNEFLGLSVLVSASRIK